MREPIPHDPEADVGLANLRQQVWMTGRSLPDPHPFQNVAFVLAAAAGISSPIVVWFAVRPVAPQVAT